MANEPVVHVIDDDEAARHSLVFLLECADLKVRSYETAVAFLKVVPSMEHGCIVTDVRMPEMSGIELLGRLTALAVPDPVIVITGHADVPLAIQAMKAGVADFIEKPFSDDVILTAVRAALTRQNDRDQARADRDRVAVLLETLSPRETEVLEGLVDGRANKVIAFDLDISARTVEIYRANVMTKMKAASLSELVRMVMTAKLA